MAAVMEDSAAKDTASGRSASKLLRYPLRSAARSKEEKPPLADSTNSHSTTKRGRLASSVTKSVSVLDLSGKEKEKSAKPPRRLSVPSKSSASPASKSFGNITPISEARSQRGKSETPLSDVSRTSSRRKFSVLASASYWLTQIKLSETAGKHTISLGFFKLALEAGCEPIQKISDELKSYVRKHDVSELGESVKELFQGYKISENYEPSEATAEPNQLSEDDARSSSSSVTYAEKQLKPKSLDVSSDEVQQVKKSDEVQQVKNSDKEVAVKDESVKKTKRSVSKIPAISKPASDVRGRSIQKKPSKPVKQEPTKGDDKAKKQGKKPTSGEVAEAVTSQPEEPLQEDKENMATMQMEEVAPAEA